MLKMTCDLGVPVHYNFLIFFKNKMKKK